MKNFFLTFAFGAMICAVASCSLEKDLDLVSDNNEEEIVVTSIDATIAAEDGDMTKTLRNADGSVWWSPGDEISLFYGNSMGKFVSTNTSNSATAQFAGYFAAVIGGGESDGSVSYFYGMYPYDRDAVLSKGKITTTVKPVQTAVAGTFAPATFVTFARSENTSLAFYNLCGGIKFKIAKEGIKKVIISGHNDENIAGKVKVDFNDKIPYVSDVLEGSKTVEVVAPSGQYFQPGEFYYAVIIPTCFASGFDMTFIGDRERATVSRTNNINIPRSAFGSLSSADKNADYEPYVEDGTVTYPVTTDLTGCTFVSTYFYPEIIEGDDFHFILALDEGYDLITSLSITMGGVDITPADWAQRYFEGNEESPAGYYLTVEDVYDEIEITAVACAMYDAPEITSVEVNSIIATAYFTDVISLEDGTSATRSYVASLRKASGDSVIESIAFNVPGGAAPALTISGLEANTEYEIRVKASNDSKDGFWSEWSSFTTGAASQSSDDTVGNIFVDFNEFVGYGSGDAANGAASTFPGAGYAFYSFNPASDALVSSANPYDKAVSFAKAASGCYAYPGYAALAANGSVSFDLGLAETRNLLGGNNEHGANASYDVEFDACVLGEGSNATVTLTFNGVVYIAWDESHSSTSTVSIPGSSSNGLVHFKTNVGYTRTSGSSWRSGEIVISSNAAILIDNIRITDVSAN